MKQTVWAYRGKRVQTRLQKSKAIKVTSLLVEPRDAVIRFAHAASRLSLGLTCDLRAVLKSVQRA